MEKKPLFSFSTVPAMSLIKVKGHNTFEWKINIIVDSRESGIFSVDGYKAQVICRRDSYYRSDRSLGSLYRFRLFFYDSSIYPVSYTFSILDREGRAFITSKGKVLKDEVPEEGILSVIYHSYLKACNLIENCTFTVRFSVHRQLDAQEGSDPIKDREDANLLETLSNDFSTFYENKTDTDCVLKVSDAQFHVHRAVLSARSSVFSAMFHHDTAESRSGEVNIQDVKATVLGDVIYYVYSGKIKGLTPNTATSMYTAADKYDLPALRTACFEFLKCNLTLDNFCEVALLAHNHRDMELEERVVLFIEENSNEVFESNIWHQFLKDKNLIASKLLMSGFKIAKNKQFRDKTSK